MFPHTVVIVGIFSLVAFANATVHCTNPLHPPDRDTILHVFYHLNNVLATWADRTVTFSRFNTPGVQGYRVPAYVTANGISTQAGINSQGTVKFDLAGQDVTLEHTNRVAVYTAAWDIVVRCILSPSVIEYTTTAGWTLVGVTSVLNVSIVNPRVLEANSSAWLPAAAAAIRR